MSSKRIKIVDPKELEVVMDRLNFTAIAKFLTDTKGVFIEDLDHRSVPYARRRLEKLTGEQIVSYAAKDGQRHGYVFRFSSKSEEKSKIQKPP